MTLLLFPMENSSNSETNVNLPKSLRNLYSLSLRSKIADLVNRKLLESMHAEILSSSNNGAFPDLIGFKTFHHDFKNYNGLLNAKAQDSAEIQYTTTKLGDVQGSFDSISMGKAWNSNAWRDTTSLVKETGPGDHVDENTTDIGKQIQYEAKLNQVMKLWVWCENQLHNCGVGVPRVEGGL